LTTWAQIQRTRTSYVPVMHCKKTAVSDISFRQSCVIEFLVKKGNLAGVIYERLHNVYGDVCMVLAVSEGGWNILRTETRISPFSRAVVDHRTDATERNKQKVDELIRQDRRITVRETAAQLGMGHIAVQEMMEILGYRKFCSRWVPRLSLQTIQKNSWELLSHPPNSPDLAPLRLPLVQALERSPERALQRHLRGSPRNREKLVARSWNGLLPQR
jgi:hypothetical protein